MTLNRKIVQLSLITIGAFLILSTYFFYPTIKESKLRIETSKEKINIQEEIKILEEKEQILIGQIQEKKEYLSSGGVLKKGTLENLQIDLQKTSSSLAEKKSALEKYEMVSSTDNVVEGNTFENVSYTGVYKDENPFILKAKKTYINTDEPNIVFMNSMHITISLDDGRVIMITSDSGLYDKINYDIFFKGNVKATDGKTNIFSDNLDLLAEESATIYNNVVLISKERGSLRADQVKYDFKSRHYQTSMFDDKKKVKIQLIK